MTEAVVNPTRAVLDALAARYAPPEWVLVEEVRVGSGWFGQGEPMELRRADQQRLDAWALRCYTGGPGIYRAAFEVKVSRTDWRRELAQPQKRRAAMLLAEQFWFVIRDGVAPVDECPDGCGLMRWTPGQGLRVVRPAPMREVPAMPARFTASVLRTAAAGGLSVRFRLADAERQAREAHQALEDIRAEHRRGICPLTPYLAPGPEEGL